MGNSQVKKNRAETLIEPVVTDDEEVDDSEPEPEPEPEPELEPEPEPEPELEPEPEQEQEQEPEPEQEQVEIPLSSLPVNDKNGAFQLLIAFINLAYARGAFKQDEVEKIIECINKFVV